MTSQNPYEMLQATVMVEYTINTSNSGFCLMDVCFTLAVNIIVKSALAKICEALMDGKPARSVTMTNNERDAVKHLCLLTMKPVVYVENVTESDLADLANNDFVKNVANVASELQSGIVTTSARA
ncbi:hypothetical protein RJT34_18299 [Clitoria ternatea]|uniref:Uncharacterized protein n=1 Tax=Clitoria ternatea TaxID=43366 RepID=A0AAN9JAI9_CLITE